mmetsp:Transcript_4218/g.8583  ORF Transcript_4218/g.8583 Transcript_4218/m.8583 type:complete len:460 (+) Transcript_4218:134-1513(+)|eukprot:Cvel_14156.t1-p1 / transcript=Cvel_14156.t1 / gene=Cvel_14156 / organism=Chromera_velia_CCMP2878 / gene_product=Eukaryotic translation initiation factor 3 subunit, putative / transcript_product=Eukaryotic translation initiation factor 3 subunit, putative / location=Cvel_scaffold997:31430-36821(+) / protein_length=459 / sequence_SO=supercontig / SO=protein_coding / is_pseudo=false
MAVFIPAHEQSEFHALKAAADWLVKATDPVDSERSKFEEAFVSNYKEREGEPPAVNVSEMFDLLLSHNTWAFQFLANEEAKAGEAGGTQSHFGRDIKAEAFSHVEAYFTVLMDLLQRLDEKESEGRLAKLIEVLKGEGKGGLSDLRMRLLMYLFNSLEGGLHPASKASRVKVLTEVLSFALKNKRFGDVEQYAEGLSEYLNFVGASEKEKGKIYGILAEGFRLQGSMANRKRAFEFGKKQMECFDILPVAERKQVQKEATALIIDAVALPNNLSFDGVADFAAVSDLRSASGDAKAAIQLVDIFLEGAPADLEAFYGKNKGLFETYKLDLEVCRRKIRLLSLTKSLQNQGQSDISLEELGKSLNAGSAEVEQWIVEAIGQGLLDGRIDQLRGVIRVKQAFQRTFGQKEWEGLRDQVRGWIGNVRELLDVLEARRDERDGLTDAIERQAEDDMQERDRRG